MLDTWREHQGRQNESCSPTKFLLVYKPCLYCPISSSSYSLQHIRRLLPDFLFEAIKSEREGTRRHYLEALEAFALSPVEFFHADNFSIKFASRVLLDLDDASRDGDGGGTHADRDNEVGGRSVGLRGVVCSSACRRGCCLSGRCVAGEGALCASLGRLVHLLQGGVQFPTPEKRPAAVDVRAL